MIALVRAELLKIRTTRGWWAYLIVIVLLTGVAVAGTVGSAGTEERGTLEFQVDLVNTVGIAVLLAIILGITIITTEFRHGTVTPTFLATPHREQVVVAKALAGVIAALGFALLSLVVVAAVALPWLTIVDAGTHLGDSEIAKTVAKQFLSTVLWVLMGVAIGTAVHSQVAALVGTLVWIFVAETLLVVLFDWLDLGGATEYLPFQALDAADGTGGGELLAYGPGVAVSVAWIAAIGAAGVIRTRRRDIT